MKINPINFTNNTPQFTPANKSGFLERTPQVDTFEKQENGLIRMSDEELKKYGHQQEIARMTEQVNKEYNAIKDEPVKNNGTIINN